jgi:hypothetical protein
MWSLARHPVPATQVPHGRLMTRPMMACKPLRQPLGRAKNLVAGHPKCTTGVTLSREYPKFVMQLRSRYWAFRRPPQRKNKICVEFRVD